jgi:hypothetical protein
MEESKAVRVKAGGRKQVGAESGEKERDSFKFNSPDGLNDAEMSGPGNCWKESAAGAEVRGRQKAEADRV